MQSTSDMQVRVDSLKAEFVEAIDHYQHLARLNYWFASLLMFITLAASVVAGIGGIFSWLDSKTTGGIALLPGAIALLATVLKPQGRANWHYRKRAALDALRRRLLYQLPASPSPDNVAAIASAWSTLDTKMDDEWEKNFALDWSQFAKPAEPNGKDPS